MNTVTIHEAKGTLFKLIEKALSGEEIIIARRNKPLVKLVAPAHSVTCRKIGSAKGKLTIASDFDTNVFLLILTEDPRLSKSAREFYCDGGNRLFLRIASM